MKTLYLLQTCPMSSLTFPGILQFMLRLVLALAFISMGVTHFLPPVKRTMAAIVPPRLRFAAAVFPGNARAARYRARFGRIAVPLLPRLIELSW
jgi:hypothetical protein